MSETLRSHCWPAHAWKMTACARRHLWSEAESRSWMEGNISTMAKYGFCQWAVVVRESDELCVRHPTPPRMMGT